MASPSVRQLCLAIACLVGLIGASLYFHTSTCSKNPAAFTHQIVNITLNGLSPSELKQVNLDWVGSDHAKSAVLAHPLTDSNSFESLVPVNGKLRLTMPDSLRTRLTSIDIHERGKPHSRLSLTGANKQFTETSEAGLTQVSHAISLNPKLSVVADQLWLWLSLGLTLVGCSFLLRHVDFCRLAAAALLTGASRKPKHQRGWFLLGFSITALAIATLEINHPFYFLQDDNYIQFLPVILQGCKSAAAGELPLFNPLQLLGAPTASVGTYALSYPFTYLAYFLAGLLGVTDATIDVFAVLHLLAAYAVMYFLLVDSRVRGSLSACGAFSYALSGFFLVAGSSWYYILPVAVWAPLMVLSVNKLMQQRTGPTWLPITSLAVGLFFHSGNAQMWFYALAFCGATLIAAYALNLIRVKQLLQAIQAVVVGIGIAFPLLYLQFVETETVWRHHDAGDISGISIPHILLPLGQTLSTGQTYPSEMCHFGIAFGAPVLVALFVIVSRISAFKTDTKLLRQLARQNIWLLGFLTALLLAWGSQGVLWETLSSLPVLNKFTQSGKLIAFVTILGIITSAVLLERIFLLTKTGKRAERLVFVFAILGLFVHLNQCNNSFYNFADAPVYPPLPTALREKCVLEGDVNKTGRTLAISPERTREAAFTDSLTHNFPTYHDVLATTGMDLLVSTNALTLTVLKDLYNDAPTVANNYGIRWIVVYHGMTSPSYGNIPWLWRYEQPDFFQSRLTDTLLEKCVRVAELEHVTLYENPDAKPIVFTAEKPDSGLATTLSTRGFSIDVRSVQSGETIIAAFIARPWLVARLDGKPIPIEADAFKRVSVTLPNTGSELRVEYEPPLLAALAGGLAIMLVGWGLAVGTRNWANGKSTSQASESCFRI